METRLDRLFILLDTGSTAVIRKSAATQLGDIVKLHPQKLRYLLNKILNLMRSKSWDTRLAAGNAIEAIVKNVKFSRTVADSNSSGEDEVQKEQDGGETVLTKFDVEAVLRDGASLFSADEQQYDSGPLGLDDTEKIQRQKLLLNKRLGLEGPAAEGMELFDDEDLMTSDSKSKPVDTSAVSTKQVREIVESQLNTEGMSVREISVAKRKARQDLKRQTSVSGVMQQCTKKAKTVSVAVEQPGQPEKILLDTVADDTMEEDTDGRWPFVKLCEILSNELFNASWEIRHGSATLLREIIKHCGDVAGVISSNNASAENLCWLEGLSVRLVCVLALDRFGDYISDEVVAPVRETCAQALGTACSYLPSQSVLLIVNKLRGIMQHETWEVRYGVVLGLKYIIAVRQNLVQQLGHIMPPILQLINDSVDDVRAVTATCLLPIVDRLPDIIPHQVDGLMQSLWDALLDLDDLTSSTHSMMALLSALLTADRLKNIQGQQLLGLVPRIWPFLHHNIASVRKASLKMLNTIFTESIDLSWLAPILMHCLRHIYQRCLTEPDSYIVELACQTWYSLVTHTSADVLGQQVIPWLNMWICLLMQPPHAPIDAGMLLKANHHKHNTGDVRSEDLSVELIYIAGPNQDKPDVRDEKVAFTRLICARCLGCLLSRLPLHHSDNVSTKDEIGKMLDYHLRGTSAIQRLCAALVLSHWIQDTQQLAQVPSMEGTTQILLRCAEESLYYDEVASLFTRLQTECKDFLACLKQQNVSLEHLHPDSTCFTIESAQRLATDDFESVKSSLKKSLVTKFTEHASGLLFTVGQLRTEFNSLNMRVQLCVASSLVSLKCFPPKLNPVIRPLMETIKKEVYSFFQNMASEKLCAVLTMCAHRAPCPNGKVFKNLCTALCASSKHTPSVADVHHSADDSSGLVCDPHNGILSLFSELKANEGTGAPKRGPKPKKVERRESEQSIEQVHTPPCSGSVQYEGAHHALWYIVSTLSDKLMHVIPTCTEHFLLPLQNVPNDVQPQALASALQVLRVIFDVLPSTIKSEVLSCFPSLLLCIKSEHTAIRYMASRAVAACAASATVQTMNQVLDEVLPLLGAVHETNWRQGAIETIYHIIDVLSVQCLPYLVLLVVPVLGRMTDQDLSVQMMASQGFASLIRLMPLEGGVPDPPEMKAHLIEKKVQERQFLEQLLNGRIQQNYGIPVPIKADLRKYQQDGVNWLAFLNKYKLHGILCDDMGLGKTLQTICIIAGDHFLRQQKFEEGGDVDSVPLPSLVVCPSTLCAHWIYEVEKFIDDKHMKALNYSAVPSERMRLRPMMKNYSLVVASYEIVRNDIDFLRTITWNYCVLDEGHVIKNPNSKTTMAVKKLQCNHRLILTGTPVQNNALELWSLFDFLMPGYLGTERQFTARYSRPICQSREARSTSKEQEAGALAVESLHKQVLPFLLRRLKSDVLQDLPPKIIQDYYCELSPLQSRLYREFGQSSAGATVQKSLTAMNDDSHEQAGIKGHIFQALQYLKKVCNHPALVLQNSKHPHHEKMLAESKARGKAITDIEYSAKLSALKQLLLDCGIGVTHSQSDGVDDVVNQHRALIFCQLKPMIDIIESELLTKCLPTVTYLRLDGSTPTNSRQDVVRRFNDDPSIDLLLLTTTVGGLGLNLTGADTVIFVEHDWNPMKDLQAMDRAHRIGQTKVVNVYRLITKHTLEEKIMGLQKFKLSIANTIINEQNNSLATMATDQLLDLFSLGQDVATDAPGAGPSKGLKSMLQNMTELWDESEYDTEYDVTNFLATLAKK